MYFILIQKPELGFMYKVYGSCLKIWESSVLRKSMKELIRRKKKKQMDFLGSFVT